MPVDQPEINPALLQNPHRSALHVLVVKEDRHAFADDQMPNDLRITPVHRSRLDLEVGSIVGPHQPGGGVGFPLRRHAVTRVPRRGLALTEGKARHGTTAHQEIRSSDSGPLSRKRLVMPW